jgi:hypothetical protein
MSRAVTAADFRVRRPICNQLVRVVVALAAGGTARTEIERISGLCHGSVCNVIRRARRAGVVVPRLRGVG